MAPAAVQDATPILVNGVKAVPDAPTKPPATVTEVSTTATRAPTPAVRISPKEQNRILFDSLPVSLPHALIDASANAAAIASAVIEQLNHLDDEGCDLGRTLLTDDVTWRDLCALTGSWRTFYGADKVSAIWKQRRAVHHPHGYQPLNGTAEIVRVDEGEGCGATWVQMGYTFATRGTPATSCSGFVAVVPDTTNNQKWKIWMFTTLLETLQGVPSPDVDKRLANMTNDCQRQTTSQKHAPETRDGKKVLPCAVAGAGFSGLCIAGRLDAMGVPVVLLEKNAELGDNWKHRYHSARFHTTRAFSEFPLHPIFDAETPTFPRRLDLVRAYKTFVDRHSLTVWCSTTLEKAAYDDSTGIWTLLLDRSGTHTVVYARHIVFSIGGLGALPRMPPLNNRDAFRGVAIHSFDYRNCDDDWKGKVGVVVGSANTAHDVAEDMVDAGLASVTLVQQSPTPVFPIEWYKQWMDKFYNGHTSIEYADRRTTSMPVGIARQVSINYYKGHMRNNPERLAALERKGFSVEHSADILKCTFGDGAGGHHTDVGGGARIVAGQIQVRGNSTVVGMTPTGLAFADGSTLDADVVIFCTGFHTNMRPAVEKIVGANIALQLDDFWGINAEGEINGAFKRQKHPGVWYIGGGAPWARFGSRFLALQIKADLDGTPLPLYDEQ